METPHVPDKPQSPSEYSKQYWTDKLTTGGITDQGLRDGTRNSWTGAVPPEAGQNKSASVVNPNPNSNAKPAWLLARQHLFSGGRASQNRKKQDITTTKKQSKSAAVSEEAPAWIQTTFQFRANNPDIGYENEAKQTQLKRASMKPNKEPAVHNGIFAQNP